MNTHYCYARLVALGKEAENRTVGEMWDSRVEQSLRRKIPRVGLGIVLKSERARQFVLSHFVNLVGHETIVGNGHQQVVFQDGPNRVIKLLVRNITDDVSLVEKEAARLQALSELMSNGLGDFWLSTNFEPLELCKKSLWAVVARQPRLREAVFYRTALDITPNTHTTMLADVIQSNHEESGLYPDLLGVGNVAGTPDTSNLKLVDTIPVVPADQLLTPIGERLTVGDLIQQRLDYWRQTD